MVDDRLEIEPEMVSQRSGDAMKLRDMIVEALKRVRVAKLKDLVSLFRPEFPDTNENTVKTWVYRCLKRMLADGVVVKEGDAWRLAETEPTPTEPECCFNCGKPLNEPLIHKCEKPDCWRDLPKCLTLVKWNDAWLPVAEWRVINNFQGGRLVILTCVYCGKEFEFKRPLCDIDFVGLFPSPCPNCGKVNLWCCFLTP